MDLRLLFSLILALFLGIALVVKGITYKLGTSSVTKANATFTEGKGEISLLKHTYASNKVIPSLSESEISAQLDKSSDEISFEVQKTHLTFSESDFYIKTENLFVGAAREFSTIIKNPQCFSPEIQSAIFNSLRPFMSNSEASKDDPNIYIKDVSFIEYFQLLNMFNAIGELSNAESAHSCHEDYRIYLHAFPSTTDKLSARIRAIKIVENDANLKPVEVNLLKEFSFDSHLGISIINFLIPEQEMHRILRKFAANQLEDMHNWYQDNFKSSNSAEFYEIYMQIGNEISSVIELQEFDDYESEITDANKRVRRADEEYYVVRKGKTKRIFVRKQKNNPTITAVIPRN